MTNAEIMARALSETTGHPATYWIDQINAVAAIVGDCKLYEHRTPEEADQLLTAFREQKAGILAWLVQGVSDGLHQKSDRHNSPTSDKEPLTNT